MTLQKTHNLSYRFYKLPRYFFGNTSYFSTLSSAVNRESLFLTCSAFSFQSNSIATTATSSKLAFSYNKERKPNFSMAAWSFKITFLLLLAKTAHLPCNTPSTQHYASHPDTYKYSFYQNITKIYFGKINNFRINIIFFKKNKNYINAKILFFAYFEKLDFSSKVATNVRVTCRKEFSPKWLYLAVIVNILCPSNSLNQSGTFPIFLFLNYLK